jgi:hypothetical protein
MLNRLLCKRCVHESHRKHKVGVIDKLIEPLNRLNMNSCYEHSHADYNYLSDRLKAICEVPPFSSRSGRNSTTSSTPTCANSRLVFSSSSTPS